MPTTQPCYQCPDRHRACHDSCEKYKQAIEELHKRKQFFNAGWEIRNWELERKHKRKIAAIKSGNRNYAGINKG